MKLSNATHYSTRDLRRFFYAGLRALGGKTDKRIEVVYSRRHCVWGCASISDVARPASYMKFAIPKNPTELKLGGLARVLRHEHAHNLGLRHGEMAADLRYCTGPDPDWIVGLAITVTAPKAPQRTGRETRYARVCERLADWTRRLRRAEGFVKKLRKAKRYYERALAARPVTVDVGPDAISASANAAHRAEEK